MTAITAPGAQMKKAIIALSLLLSFNGAALAANQPAAASSFEDPNNIYSEAGTHYQAAKKKLGGCAATAPGNTTDARLINASGYSIDTPNKNAFTRAASSAI